MKNAERSSSKATLMAYNQGVRDEKFILSEERSDESK
jgi:hypothetical protein